MTKTGYVSKIKDGYTYVITECESSCGHNCATCSSECKSNLRESIVQNTVGAKVGDRVEMSVADSKIVLLSFLVYMLPLVVLFATWIVCDYLMVSIFMKCISIFAVVALWIVFIVKYNKKGIINKIERIL